MPEFFGIQAEKCYIVYILLSTTWRLIDIKFRKKQQVIFK